MVRVGLIGSGMWGRKYIKAVNESGCGEVVKIFNTGLLKERIRASLVNDSFRWGDTKQGFLIESSFFSSLDAVIVATHPPTTELYTIELLKMGIPVMAEKPFTFNPAVLDLIEQVLARHKQPPTFLINHQHLFSHSIDCVKAVIGERRIETFVSEAGNLGPHRKYSPLWDYGPHDLAILAYLGGSDLKLINHSTFEDDSGRDETALLEFNSINLAHIRVWNNRAPKTHRVQLGFLRHKIIYDDFDLDGKIMLDGRYVPISEDPPLSRSVKAFLANVHATDSHNDLRFGVHIVRAYTGQLCLAGTSDFQLGYDQ